MTNKFTRKAEKALQDSMQIASLMGHTYIGSEHLLLGLCQDEASISSKLLLGQGVDPRRVREAVVALAGEGEKSHLTAADMTPRTRRIIERSATLSHGSGQNYIGTEHLLLALLGEGDCVAVRILAMLGISVDEIRREAKRVLDMASGQGYPPDDTTATYEATGNRGRRESGRDTTREGGESREAKPRTIAGAPTLSKHGRDLTAMAEAGRLDPIIGRDEETGRLICILSRRQKNNPCLIGEPGVGKTAVVEGLANRICEGNVPETMRDKRVVTLDLASMVAGAKYRGEFEERLKLIMEEVRKNPNIILFIDEIHTIIGAGAAEGAVDAANIIKPALARGEMQVIGATTISEYRKHIEKDAALERRFQSVMVGEPTPEAAKAILEGLRSKYETHHRLKISDEAIIAAVTLSVRYLPDRYLPDKAIDLLDEAAARLRMTMFETQGEGEVKALEATLSAALREKEEAILAQDFETAAMWRDEEAKCREALERAKTNMAQQQDTTPPVLEAEHIAHVVTQWTGIPVTQLQEQDNQKLLHLEDALKAQVVGQNSAVAAVAGAIRRGRLGLADPQRPMGSFIFLGPTGVGKTELCKGLARVLFGDERAMIRLDMSEYMEKHSVANLIGAPPGYVGHEEGGRLIQAVRKTPYAVVLFDEIEKAHPDVFNILLQVLDDGVLTDTQGRRADFKNTVLIMTSNLGATKEERRALGFTTGEVSGDKGLQKEARERMMTALKKTFKPEFINRVDDIVIFHPLGREEIKNIAIMLLQELKDRVLTLGIDITFDDSIIDLLAEEGFDTAYGARPLRRAVVRLLQDPLSNELLTGHIQVGQKVKAIVKEKQVVFERDK